MNTNGDVDAALGKSHLPPSSAATPAPAAAPAPGHREHGLITVQPLRRSEMQPSYAQDLGLEDVDHGFYGTMINGLGACAGFFGQVPCCFCCPNPFQEVNQGSVGLVSRFGQFYKSVDPGLVRVNPCSESVRIVDVKIQLSAIPRQQVMTRDNVNTEIDSVIYWHISNPYRASYGIGDVRQALVERAQTTLRHVVGSRALQSVVSDREAVALEIEEIVEGVAEKWGVTIESILIKDIVFSRELQESLSSAATQKRIGESKVIAARAEVDAARLMRQAADILASPAAMQIRQLEALQAMAKSAGSKVIFVPMSLGEQGGQAMAQIARNESAANAAGEASGSGSGSAGGLGLLQTTGNTAAGAGTGSQGMTVQDVGALNQIANV